MGLLLLTSSQQPRGTARPTGLALHTQALPDTRPEAPHLSTKLMYFDLTQAWWAPGAPKQLPHLPCVS